MTIHLNGFNLAAGDLIPVSKAKDAFARVERCLDGRAEVAVDERGSIIIFNSEGERIG